MAEIIEATQLDGQMVRARVKVTGPAPKGLPVPEGVVGREGEIERSVLFDWELEAGAKVLLSLDESRRFLCPDGADPSPELVPCGPLAHVTEGDVNRDGFPEQVLDNAFIRAVVSPHHGARLSGLTVAASGVDLLSPSYELSSDFVDLGGCEDRLGDGNGELWKLKVPVAEASAAPGPCARVAFRAQPEESKGLTLSKQVEVECGLPAVRLELAIHYAGKDAPTQPRQDGSPQEEEKDRFDLTYQMRIAFRPSRGSGPAELGSDLRVDLPLAERVESLHYHRGMWWYPLSGLSLGAACLDDERTGSALLVLTDPGLLGNVNLDFDCPALEVRLRMLPEKLEPGRQRTFGALLAAGCSCAASHRMVALASLGVEAEGRVALAVVARHLDAPQAVAHLGGEVVPLTQRHWVGVGSVLTGCARLASDQIPDEVHVEAAGDRLGLPIRNGARR